MAIGDAFKRAADYGRKAADTRAAQRPWTVTVRLDTYSAPPRTQGATLVDRAPTTLAPNPKVEFAADLASVFGGGLRSGPNPNLSAGQIRVGPLTPAYPGGGYDPATLLPTPRDATQRVYLLVTGPGLSAAGEVFDIERVEADHPQRWFIVATRTSQTPLG